MLKTQVTSSSAQESVDTRPQKRPGELQLGKATHPFIMIQPLSHERAENIALTFTQNPVASQQVSAPHMQTNLINPQLKIMCSYNTNCTAVRLYTVYDSLVEDQHKTLLRYLRRTPVQL